MDRIAARFAHREEIHALVLAARHHDAGGFATDLKAVHRAGVRGEFLMPRSVAKGEEDERAGVSAPRRLGRDRWQTTRAVVGREAARSARKVPRRGAHTTLARDALDAGLENEEDAPADDTRVWSPSLRARRHPARGSPLCASPGCAERASARLGRLVFENAER
jgi:hypothetical protein